MQQAYGSPNENGVPIVLPASTPLALPPKDNNHGDSVFRREPPTPPEKPVTPVLPPSYDEFLSWCTNVMGIQSKLTIETFQYLDYLQAHTHNIFEQDDDFCDDDDFVAVEEYPRISVRGLAAAQDIQEGEVVIAIPLNAMISVPTTIDHDPVLSQILGPQAREKNGWDDAYFEMGLLTVAVLYHRNSLGSVSPLFHYMNVLSSSPTDLIPFLWSKDRLRRDASDGVRKIARDIQRDVKEMYVTVMEILKAEHPQTFDSEVYSLHMFRWAFALVNSRHWNLPIRDLDPPPKMTRARTMTKKQYNTESYPAVDEQVPPADQPTDEWVQMQSDMREEEEALLHDELSPSGGHSFLAPVADLMNFGPPCTRGKYNEATQTFDIIATCSFVKGQEVTYWYSDDCADVMIANFGFVHPMVPSCGHRSEWRYDEDKWRRQVENLQMDLSKSYEDLDRLDRELSRMHARLRDCNCEDDTQPQQHADVGVRGSNNHNNGDHHGIRRKKESELGL